MALEAADSEFWARYATSSWALHLPIILAFGFLVLQSCCVDAHGQCGGAGLTKEFWKITVSVRQYLFLAIFVGITYYLQLALNYDNLMEDWERETGYREKKGLKTVVGICVAAISFSLIFRLQRSRGFWWEARSCVGKMICALKCVVMASVKCVDLTGNKTDLEDIATYAKLYFECTRCQLQDVKLDGEGLESLLDRIREVKETHPDDVALLEFPIDTIKKSDWGCDAICPADSTGEDEEDGATRLLLASNTHRYASLVAGDELEDFENGNWGSRVLLAWKWLYLSVSKGNVAMPSEFYKQLDSALSAYHGAMKVKKHADETSGIDVVQWWVMHLLLALLFPVSLAYEFHLKYPAEDLKHGVTLMPGTLALYVLSLLILIYFLSALSIVAKEARDPYGNDDQDIPLVSMAKTFFSDIDLLAKK